MLVVLFSLGINIEKQAKKQIACFLEQKKALRKKRNYTMLNDLKEIISIKSVLSEKKENAPFGTGSRQALDWFLEKAKKYGLKTVDLDGYCGYAEYGEGEKCVAALCHLDVVPVSDDWSSDPFTLLVEDGVLYGRGVADDKGAAVMCLHALKEIAASGEKFKNRIRLIVGLNEEHDSRCIKHYVEKDEMPAVSIVPDADFPIINSEKGILQIKVRLPLDKFFKNNIAAISGGESFNVVPDKASISIFKDSDFCKQLQEIGDGKISDEIFKKPEVVGAILAAGHRIEDFSIINKQDIVVIETVGMSGHAMEPSKSDNAIWKLFTFLGALTNDPMTEFMNNFVACKDATNKIGIFRSDEQSGETTMSMGIIDVDDDNLNFTLDIRLPICIKDDEVKKSIQACLPRGGKIEVIKYSPNLFVSSSTPFIQSLLDVYAKVTGGEKYCLKCGGGTYARELKNAVAFGPTFPGAVTNLHKGDENLRVDEFYKAFEVYKEAFKMLGNMDV
jgi:succinyl-diaminopimelate desuccinylase